MIRVLWKSQDLYLKAPISPLPSPTIFPIVASIVCATPACEALDAARREWSAFFGEHAEGCARRGPTFYPSRDVSRLYLQPRMQNVKSGFRLQSASARQFVLTEPFNASQRRRTSAHVGGMVGNGHHTNRPQRMREIKNRVAGWYFDKYVYRYLYISYNRYYV
jgi:hypothetical protein